MLRESLSDGTVTIRRFDLNDLERDLEAKDEEQITWLWGAEDREKWVAMSSDQRRTHARATITMYRDTFGPGPKWSFAVDADDESYVAYVDCDLANQHVPHGQANVAYASHPAFRGSGYVSRAVRLVFRYLEENTEATEAHINVAADNEPSLRVARAVGAEAANQWVDEQGNSMIRFVYRLR